MGRINEAMKRFDATDAVSPPTPPGDIALEPRALPPLDAYRKEPSPVSGDAVTLPPGPADSASKRPSHEIAPRPMAQVVASDSAPKPGAPAPVDTVYDRLVPLDRPVSHDRSVPEVHLLDYLRVVQRRRWAAVLVAALVIASTAWYAFTATPIYEATTTLLIESDKRNAVTFSDVTDQSPTTDEYYQTRYKLLASQSLAARTLDALDLWSHPEFDPLRRPDRNDTPSALNRVLETATSTIRSLIDSVPDSMPDVSDATRRSATVDSFLRHLTVSPVRNTHLVEVKFRSTDRTLAANAANAHAEAFIQQNLESTVSTSRDVSGWLEGQLAEQRKKVEESEIAVQKYREQNNALGLDERQNIVNQKLADLSGAVTKAKTVRMEKEALYRQVEAVEHDPKALASIPVVLSNQYIQQLKVQVGDLQRQQSELSEQLGSRHPDLIKATSAAEAAEAKLESAMGQMVQALRTDYMAALDQENNLARALKDQQGEALAFNRTAIQGNVLRRDADSNRQLYDGLLQRTKESGIVGELKPSNIRIVDQATVPRRPVSPDKVSLLLLGLIGGPLLGVGLVFFLEYLDNRIRTPDEVREHLGLPTLGLVPRLVKSSGPQLLTSEGTPENFAEAFRGVRTALLLSHTGGRARTVLVTSTMAGEGKTLAASNLAIGFAQAGERVLLVDCDVRRPSVHLLFDVDQQPGLSDLLVGQARANDTIRRSGIADLWVLPAGRLAPNPAELLGSRQFKDFLSSVDQLYDRIVLDSPPALAVTDATILGHLAGGIVFVVNAHSTDRHAAATAVARLASVGGHLIGAVLNQANVDRRTYEYYGGYN